MFSVKEKLELIEDLIKYFKQDSFEFSCDETNLLIEALEDKKKALCKKKK